ncbi:nucleoside hydrolase-like domain-containing protein [Streptomyces niveus]|uniref:DUF1593 domain-containing protein n=1 Tax=Streptomyces niveus TaxID=193462 RepID=UPI0036E80F46
MRIHYRRSVGAIAAGAMMASLAVADVTNASATPAGVCVAAGKGRSSAPAVPQQPSEFRTIITSDGEIDDLASFHRLLMYSNDLADSLVGIVYSSSHAHWAGDPTADPPIPPEAWAGTHVYQDAIAGGGEIYGTEGGYAAAYKNLARHDRRYPTPQHLLSLIKVGNVTTHGEMDKDTEGSELIKRALLDDDPRPIWLQIWGGTNTVSAALRSIEDEYRGTPKWNAVYKKVVSKARMYIVFDQDPTYKQYIRQNWPDLKVTMNRDQFLSIAYSAFRTGSNFGGARTPTGLDEYFGADFMADIKYGPVLATYPVDRDGAASNGEGDSPSYWHLLPNGLRSAEDPSFGGWGGRFDQNSPSTWTDWPDYMEDPEWYLPFDSDPPFRDWDASSRTSDATPYGTRSYELGYPQARWIPALQNELAARAQWQTRGYAGANHPPVVAVSEKKLNRTAVPGQVVRLKSTASDPDGDALRCRWWQYAEAGTYAGDARVARADSLNASVRIPDDARAGDTIHVVLEVTDDGEFPITRYQRVVITVR